MSGSGTIEVDRRRRALPVGEEDSMFEGCGRDVEVALPSQCVLAVYTAC